MKRETWIKAAQLAALVATLLMTVVASVLNTRTDARAPGQPRKMEATEATYDLQSGRVIVVEVPVTGLQRATERQTCFVWQPKESGAAGGFQCPNDRASYTVDPPER